MTRLGGKLSVNPSGGLAGFGEAAQALAQVCELSRQLGGETGERQLAVASAGITAIQAAATQWWSHACLEADRKPARPLNLG